MKFRYEVELSKFQMPEDEAKKLTQKGQKEVFEIFLGTLFGTKYPEGVSGLTTRVLNKVLEKLDVASDGIMEIDEKEVELLKEVFVQEVRVHPRQVRYYSALQANFEKGLEELKKSE